MAIRRGDLAKESITKTLLNTFPGSFVVDKKIYVPITDDGNDEVQIAISLTMPKVPVAAIGEAADNAGTGADSAFTVAPTALSSEDEAKVKELMKNLGIAN